jgi:hypothetical protein
MEKRTVVNVAVTVRRRIEINKDNAIGKYPGSPLDITLDEVGHRKRPLSKSRQRRENIRKIGMETDAKAREFARVAAAEVESLLSKDPAGVDDGETVQRVETTEARLGTLEVIRDTDVVEFDHGKTTTGTEGFAIYEKGGKARRREQEALKRRRRHLTR